MVSAGACSRGQTLIRESRQLPEKCGIFYDFLGANSTVFEPQNLVLTFKHGEIQKRPLEQSEDSLSVYVKHRLMRGEMLVISTNKLPRRINTIVLKWKQSQHGIMGK